MPSKVGVDAELLALAGRVGDLGGVQQRLGRDAAAVQAGAAELVLLDQGDRQAELGGAQRARVAAAAAAEDDQVELAAGSWVANVPPVMPGQPHEGPVVVGSPVEAILHQWPRRPHRADGRSGHRSGTASADVQEIRRPVRHTGLMGWLARLRGRGADRGRRPGGRGAVGVRPADLAEERHLDRVRAEPPRRRGLRRAAHRGHRRDPGAGRARRRVDPPPGAVGRRGRTTFANEQGIPSTTRRWSATRSGCASTNRREKRAAPRALGAAASEPASPAGAAGQLGPIASRPVRGPAAPGSAPRTRCRPWACSRSARPSLNAGPGDVQVRPRDAVADELLQERRRRTACRPTGRRCAASGRRPCWRCGPSRASPPAAASATAPRRPRSPAAVTWSRSASSLPITPAIRSPSATTQRAGQGGDVDDHVGLRPRWRVTSASASTSRPSASVLSTSTVLPPYMVSTSPGRSPCRRACSRPSAA